MSTDFNNKRVLCIGAAHLDKVFTFFHTPHEEEELPASSEDIFGGCAYNSACALRLQGIDVSFVTLLGQDIAGDQVISNLQSLGVDTSQVHHLETAQTGMYVSFHRPSGDLFIAAADMDVYRRFTPEMLEQSLTNHEPHAAWVFDAEWRKEVFEFVANLDNTPDIYLVITFFFKAVTG